MASAASQDGGSRRARNKARTRAAILDASLACITEAGVQATTMDQIAIAARVARATLFNYFPSKQDIVDALVMETDAGFLRAVDSWREAPGLTTGERLLGLFAATARYLRSAPASRRALIGLSWLNWAEPPSVARVGAVRRAFAQLLEGGRRSGDVPATLDITLAADLVCHAYLGIVHSWWLSEALPIAERCDGTARLLARMIDPDAQLPQVAPTLAGERRG